MNTEHTYEEIRSVVIELLQGNVEGAYSTTQFANLVSNVGEVLAEREGAPNEASWSSGGRASLSGIDAELVGEVFWDLFRQGIITLGSDYANPNYPHFRVTARGKKVLDNQNPYFFHDVSGYRDLLAKNVPDFDDVTLTYAQEAVQAFRSGCMLSATVMLGVASEHSFQLLLESAVQSASYGEKFNSASKKRLFSQQFTAFRSALKSHVVADLPQDLREHLEVNLDGVLNLIRIYRNESGHPTGKLIDREQVYINLQLFVPYSRTLYQLKNFFSNH